MFSPEEEASLATSAVAEVPLETRSVLCLLNEIDKANASTVLIGENPHESLFGFQSETKAFIPYPERSYLSQCDGTVFSLRVSTRYDILA